MPGLTTLSPPARQTLAGSGRVALPGTAQKLQHLPQQQRQNCAAVAQWRSSGFQTRLCAWLNADFDALLRAYRGMRFIYHLDAYLMLPRRKGSDRMGSFQSAQRYRFAFVHIKMRMIALLS